LVKISYIRAMAEKAGIIRIHEEQRKIIFDFHEKSQLTPKRIADLSAEYGMGILVHAGLKPFIKFSYNGKNKLHQVTIFLNKLMV
ncbi:MAG: hypothetical protein AAGU75_07705, partial [Bacillota bacterium]